MASCSPKRAIISYKKIKKWNEKHELIHEQSKISATEKWFYLFNYLLIYFLNRQIGILLLVPNRKRGYAPSTRGRYKGRQVAKRKQKQPHSAIYSLTNQWSITRSKDNPVVTDKINGRGTNEGIFERLMQSLHSIKNQRLYSWHTVKNKHKEATIQTFLLFPKNCHDSPDALLSLHRGAPRGDQIESTTGATVPLPIMDGDTFSCFLTQATIVFGKDHPPVLQLSKAKILCQVVSHAKKHTSDGPKNTNFP